MAIIDRSIRLTERGVPAIVPDADWQALDLEEPCRILADKGIIRLKSIGAFKVIEPRQFVGHLRLPGRGITISPKSNSLFTSLHKFVASPPDKKVAAEEAQSAASDLHILDPVVAFYKALADATQEGLPFAYERVSTATSRPKGRFLINETLRSLRTHGISHKVVCSFNVRKFDRYLGAIISTVTSLLKTGYDIPHILRLRIDSLLSLFEDSQVLSAEQAYESSTILLSTYSEQRQLVRLLMICQSILAAERIIWDTEIPVSGGECRFCNMDRLWELAIWTAFRKAAINNNGMSVEFHPLAKMKMMLLMDGGPRIDPDIVIYREGKPFIIADAKYSESKSAVADDVYQIVCYTQRLKAEKGILIYLSAERGWFSSLGFSADGSELLAAGIDKTESVALNLTTTALNTLSVG